MNKQSIIFAMVLLLVFGALWAGYQFSVKEKWERYGDDQAFFDALEAKRQHFEKTFSRTLPEVVVTRWEEAVDPWKKAVEDRTRIYDIEDAFQIVPVPEGKMAWFHYEDQFREMLSSLQMDVLTQQVRMTPTSFGAPSPESVSTQTLQNSDVEEWLRLIAFGTDTVEMLMEAGAYEISAVEIWPPRTVGGVLEMRTVGLAFMMRLDSLAEFLDTKTSDSREFYDINGFRIVNRQLRASPDPFLEVEMLLTRADFVEGGQVQAQATSAAPAPARNIFGGGGSAPGLGRRDGASTTPKVRRSSWVSKLWPFGGKKVSEERQRRLDERR